MLSEIEIRNLQTVNGMLEEFRASMNDAEKGLREIDDKYKAIIEKEKKMYKETISNCKKELDFWEKPILKRYGKSISELLAKPEDVIEAEPENVEPEDMLPFVEDEKVVDKEAEEVIPEEEIPIEEIREEAKVEEPVGEIEVSSEPVPEEWEENAEAEAQKENDEWDFPEEWK